MGDGADMCLEMMEDFEEARGDYRSGNMTCLEAYDRGIIDELGYEINSGTVSREGKVCRCCGKGNLYWQLKDDKWRLFEGDSYPESKIHQCPSNPLNT